MKNRVDAVRKRLAEAGADAFICHSYPNYCYLTGFTGSLAVVLITLERAVILTDFRYRTQVREEAREFDFVEIKGRAEEIIGETIREFRIKRLAFEAAHLTYRQYAQLRELDAVELMPTEDWIKELRAVKDAREVERIERAASIADQAMETVLEELRAGMTEQEVANRINFLLRSAGAKKEAFDLIVASGPRSAMPHGASTERQIKTGEPVVIDIGAQYGGYHSDLTRTAWLDKIVSQQVLEIYEIVENAQAAALRAIRPGLSCVEVDAIARDLIVDAGYGECFGHGLGHGVGLEVHESPVISRLGKGNIKPGMVFTVEPGIYIPDVGGVRIEDLVLVTDEGCRLLSKSRHRPSICV